MPDEIMAVAKNKSVTEIRSLASRLRMRHANRVSEQRVDQQYYDDTFIVNIDQPFHIVRTGTGARIVDSIVDYIETANPQIFREPRKQNDKERESAVKIARLLNSWVIQLIPQISEGIRNAVHYGEGIFQIEYNPDYDKSFPEQLPIIVTALNPLVTYTEPYDSFIPEIVVKLFDMDVSSVKSQFPEWRNPKTRAVGTVSGVNYLAYWDKYQRYFEGNKASLVSEGATPNPYGFMPFVHFYAGFGKKSPEGRPEHLAAGRLRKLRGRLKEESEIESRIDSIIALYANPIVQIEQSQRDADEIDRQAMEEQPIGPGTNLVTGYGWKQTIFTPNVPAAQLFAHLGQIQRALDRELPPGLLGIASGPRSSGRLEDVLSENVERKYSQLKHNVETAIATVLSMALRILDTIPEALPITTRATVLAKGESPRKEELITKKDIDGYYAVIAELNPEEAIQRDREVMLGRTLLNEGRISWREFLIDYMHKTNDEADETMAEALAEQAIISHPALVEMRVRAALEQIGATDFLRKLEEENVQQAQGQELAQQEPPQQRPSEARNPVAAETLRQSLEARGARRPPTQ